MQRRCGVAYGSSSNRKAYIIGLDSMHVGYQQVTMHNDQGIAAEVSLPYSSLSSP